MSVFRFVLVFLLAAVAATAFASCGGDGKKSGLLAAGEYQFTVSGTLEIEFPAATTSALPMGASQAQDTGISGDVKLKMNDDGSFEFEGWGIKATVKEDGGGTANLNLGDSTKKKSTGMTDKDGTKVDIYWKADLKNREQRSGTNDSTIGGSSPDALGPNTGDIKIDVDNPPIPFADSNGKTIFIINGGTIILSREQAGQTPQAQPTTPAPQPTTPAPQVTPTPGGETPQVRTEQKIKCQHTKPGVKSDLFDALLLFLVGVTPQSRENGQPSTLVLHIASPDGQGLTGPALTGQEVPLAGATVTVSVQGPGVLDNKVSGVTDANGQVTVRAGINKFGAYNMTIDSVVGADGTVYGFDQNSVLSLTYEVGPVCELTPTPSR